MRALLTGAALTCLTGTTVATIPAHAASRAGSDGGGETFRYAYGACQPQRQYQPSRKIATFDNQPLDGCQVVLTNRAGESTVLCEGRGEVPAEFRRSPQVRVQPGTAPECAEA
ncbi:hypothetical protein FE391_20335 [Nonomuraea sp. KC401]|uniref:hypothetical protein n=1 Tax=unclassified Nonomuraea TaxID=2593643 RepID=UPI0010FD0FC0|nr:MULTISPECIES: hypothetical protein [unclassified Nonomuraea]NBE96191.1 hypothetical protein [Nonomuraea sp. K271]TLF71110.1 hypothetical protein FE391_20335 [Nonomuraea sp. KC401]